MRVGSLVLFGLLGSMVSGCVTVTAGTLSPEQREHEAAGRFIYPRPLDEVWPEVTKLFDERNLRYRQSGTSYELVTDWKEALDPSIAAVWVRYRAVGEQLGPDQSMIRIIRSQLVHNPGLSTRQPSRGEAMFDINPYQRQVPVFLTVKHKKNEDRAQAGTDDQAQRELEMEWTLLQRTVPDAAEAIRIGARR